MTHTRHYFCNLNLWNTSYIIPFYSYFSFLPELILVMFTHAFLPICQSLSYFRTIHISNWNFICNPGCGSEIANCNRFFVCQGLPLSKFSWKSVHIFMNMLLHVKTGLFLYVDKMEKNWLCIQIRIYSTVSCASLGYPSPNCTSQIVPCASLGYPSPNCTLCLPKQPVSKLYFVLP